ncbi:hypothetical protein PUN28_013958 [Cardiocondyla obscurior]|uniref:Zinc finger protein n=1 Tax=Cardiocondyla obscurior TaxID=286306 RepID=A0AAW2F458_9HYME
MSCRDFLIRVCQRENCSKYHEIRRCTKNNCTQGSSCKYVHLRQEEVDNINNNIRPHSKEAYEELKRIAYLLRETYPEEQKKKSCTLNFLGECLWTCIACGTADAELPTRNMPTCNYCEVKLIEGFKALVCGHAYCKYCIPVLPFSVDGPLPCYYCSTCKAWKKIMYNFKIYNQ